MASRPSNVVDFHAFKAARAAQAAGQLSLLEPVSAEAPRPQGAEPERPLSDRGIAHRARMLAHLLSEGSQAR